MKRFCLLLFLAVTLGAQVMVQDLADITGDGSAHAISTTSIRAYWIIIACPSGNSAAVRIGSSSVSSSRGLPCAAGGAVNYYPAQSTPQYDLSKIYYLAANGDKLSVQYGQ